MSKKNSNTNSNTVNWTGIFNEAQTACINFVRGDLTLRNLISSITTPNLRRQLYGVESNGGTPRARRLARIALRRRGVHV